MPLLSTHPLSILKTQTPTNTRNIQKIVLSHISFTSSLTHTHSISLSLSLQQMEKKETTTSNPLGMCEKIFNAFNPTFRPLRRLTFRNQEPESTADTSRPLSRHPSDSDANKPNPPKPLPTPVKLEPAVPEKKASEVVPPKVEPPSVLPRALTTEKEKDKDKDKDKAATPPLPPPEKVKATTTGTTTTNNYYYYTTEKVKPIPPPPPPALPTPQPPRAVVAPPPPPRAVQTPEPPEPPRPRRNINEKVDDYISRTKNKMRSSASAVMVRSPPTQ